MRIESAWPFFLLEDLGKLPQNFLGIVRIFDG